MFRAFKADISDKQPERRLNVFVCYARVETKIADDIVAYLESHDFDVRIDRRDLPYGEKWWGEIAEMIHACDTVVWLVSAASIESKWCLRELGEAERRGKRLLPVRIVEVPPEGMPPSIGEFHVLPAEGRFSLSSHGETLLAALRANQAWLKELTRLQDRAKEWRQRNRSSAVLLRGTSLRAAEAWRDAAGGQDVAPTAETLDYILESRRASTRRLTVFATVAGVIGAAAIILSLSLQLARSRADEQTEIAKLQRDASRAQFAATQDPAAGLALAVDVSARAEAIYAPDPPPAEIRSVLPSVADAAREMPRLRGQFDGQYANVVKLHPDPDGEDRLLIVMTEMVLMTDFDGRPLAPPLNANGPSGVAFANDARWIKRAKEDLVVVGSGSLQGADRKALGIGVSLFDSDGRLMGQALTDHPHPIMAVLPLDAQGTILAGDSQGNLYLVDTADFSHRRVLEGSGRAVTDIAREGNDWSYTVAVAFGDTVDTRQLLVPERVGRTPRSEEGVARSVTAALGDSRLEVGLVGWEPGDGVSCVIPTTRSEAGRTDAFLVCDQDGPPEFVPSTIFDGAGTFGKVRPVAVASGVTAATACRHGNLLAVGDGAGSIHVFQSDGVRVTARLRHGTGPVAALAFTPDCAILMSATIQGSDIRRWDLADVADLGSRLYDAFETVVEMQATDGGERLLALYGNWGPTAHVEIFDHEDVAYTSLYRHAMDVDRDMPLSAALSPDGTHFAFSANGRVTVMTVTGQTLWSAGFAAESLAFSADGQTLLGTGATGTTLWPLVSGAGEDARKARTLREDQVGPGATALQLPQEAREFAAFALADGNLTLSFHDETGALIGRTKPLTLRGASYDASAIQDAALAAQVSALFRSQLVSLRWDAANRSFLAIVSAQQFASTGSQQRGSRIFRIDPETFEVSPVHEIRMDGLGLEDRRVVAATDVVAGAIGLVLQRGSGATPGTVLQIVETDNFRQLTQFAVPMDGSSATTPIMAWSAPDGSFHVGLDSGTVIDRSFRPQALREVATGRLQLMAREAEYDRLLVEASALRNSGDTAGAIEASRRATELLPHVSIPWLNIGNWSCHPPTGRGDCDAADTAFSSAIDAVPLQPLAHLQRGKLRFFRGTYEAALADFEIASRIQTGLPTIEAGRASLGGWEQFADMIRGLHAGMINEPKAFRAYALSHLERWAEAETAYQELAQIGTPSLRDREYRARALYELGRSSEALSETRALLAALSDGAPYSKLEEFADKLKQDADRNRFACEVVQQGLRFASEASAPRQDVVALVDIGLDACSAIVRDDPEDADAARLALVALRDAAQRFNYPVALDETLLDSPGEVLDRLIAEQDREALAEFREAYSRHPVSAKAGLALARLRAVGGNNDAVGRDIAGVWLNDAGKPKLEIMVDEKGLQLWTNADPDHPFAEIGQVVARTRQTEQGSDWPFMGEHIWIGESKTTWGAEGALVAAIIDDSTLFYAYLDSKFKAGWTLKKSNGAWQSTIRRSGR
ncbi:TIR domain-containing protein [Primorskyibacter flagellatus]|uniref:TIR domain-containing protein n=1 Tax=Primorskyibacter flagellatus TaxID=1387277 RepID=UPI003A8EFA29